jgi:HlyD family secretion protein
MRRRTRLGELAIAVGLAGVLTWLFWPQPIDVEVAELSRGPVVAAVRGEGRVRLKELYVVAAPVAGRLERIILKPGDAVLTGEAVARIVPALPDLRAGRDLRVTAAALRAAEAGAEAAAARVAAAEARAAYADRRLRRITVLERAGVAAAAALDAAAADFAAARAAVAAAQAGGRAAGQLSERLRAALLPADPDCPPPAALDVVAPAAGRVLRVVQESETVVTPGQPLLLLGDPAAVEVELMLPSEQAADLRPGMTARLERWGGAALPGRVARIEPAGRRRLSLLGFEESWAPVVIDLLGSPEGLWPGWRVDVIIERETREELRIPVGALVRRGDDWTAYVVEDGRVHQRPLSGLRPGMQVVVFPGERVADGATVRARN